MQAGNLPAMQALSEKGCRVRSVMSSFPSIIGYAYWPLLTGIDATWSGHLGTRYFDRRLDAGNWRNHYGPGGSHFEPTFDTHVRTLFEVAASHKKGWTLSGNSMLKRGANVTYAVGRSQCFLSKGVRAWRGDTKAWSAKVDEPLVTFGADKDLLIGIQGDASDSIYVKSIDGWLSRTYEGELRSYKVPGRDDVDLMQTALAYQGVELVACSRENGVVVVQTDRKSVV